jgi:hypothetical protein
MPTDHGGTSEWYLYERLTEKRFQQLCSALLVREFPGVTCFPVGQKDGGRDAVRKAPGQKMIIYQVKWAGLGVFLSTLVLAVRAAVCAVDLLSRAIRRRLGATT